jgi:hypothetical protein
MKQSIGTLVAFVLTLTVLTSAADEVVAQSRIQILSATVRDQKIAGATVILQKNGEQSFSAVTDLNGQAQLGEPLTNDPSTLLIVRNIGYSDLVAKCPCGGMTYALSPTMQRLDGMRIVLNWGPNPSDLDGHLVFSGNHIYFFNRTGADAKLDVDHVDGYGPETITILRKHSGERYVYAVQDFSDKQDPESNRLSRSDAKVFVYVGQTLIKAYYVPRSTTGNVWTVFAVSEAGELQDINSMSSISALDIPHLTPELIFGTQLDNASHLAATPSPPLPISASARKLNTLGESAYRAGDYAEAVRLFQSAIEQDATYGQAYSNLGLVFQKSGRIAEALWANRKAIALANGPQAATTRAGTHFNNGKIYENALQWDDALREYMAAAVEKPNAIYEDAAQRMRNRRAN